MSQHDDGSEPGGTRDLADVWPVAFMDHSAVGMTLTAPDGRVVRVNAAAADFFGLSASELERQGWQGLTPPEDVASESELLADIMAGNRDSYRLLKHFTRADGGEVWGDVTVSAVRGSDGTLQYIAAQVIDVTERQRATQELVDREANYRLLADNMTDVIVRSGADGAIVWVSPSVAEILGWRPVDLVGRRMPELMHPDDRAAVLDQKRAILASGRTEGRVIMRIATASGGWLWMSDHGRAIMADGAVIGGIDSLRDVDAQHRAQQELRERERELRGVIDTLLDPWVLLAAVRDHEGPIVDFVFVDANGAACAAIRHPRERLLGARLLDLLPGHGTSGLLQRYARVVETGDPLTVDDEPLVDVDDGREHRFDIRSVRVGDGVSVMWRNVTERYEMRRLLHQEANQDLLTGLANRRQLEVRMGEIFARAPRTGTSIGVLYCDIDLFKDINDTMGHAFGDHVLATVGSSIRDAVREADLVARVGGDEFVVILDGVRGADDARAVAAKVARAVRRPIVVASQTVEPRISIGVAVTSYGADSQDALTRADEALYRAKKAGRDRIEVDGKSGPDASQEVGDGGHQPEATG